MAARLALFSPKLPNATSTNAQWIAFSLHGIPGPPVPPPVEPATSHATVLLLPMLLSAARPAPLLWSTELAKLLPAPSTANNPAGVRGQPAPILAALDLTAEPEAFLLPPSTVAWNAHTTGRLNPATLLNAQLTANYPCMVNGRAAVDPVVQVTSGEPGVSSPLLPTVASSARA
jgi:hypothetical protein